MIKNTLGERPWNSNCGFCALHCGRTHKHTRTLTRARAHTQVLSCCSHYHVNKAKYSAIVPPQLLHLATSMGLALSSATHVLVCLLWAFFPCRRWCRRSGLWHLDPARRWLFLDWIYVSKIAAEAVLQALWRFYTRVKGFVYTLKNTENISYILHLLWLWLWLCAHEH